MIGRRRSAALRQLLKLAPEDVIHSELSRNLLGDIQITGAAGIQVHFLKDQEIGLLRL
jgi:hypothetical protein